MGVSYDFEENRNYNNMWNIIKGLIHLTLSDSQKLLERLKSWYKEVHRFSLFNMEMATPFLSIADGQNAVWFWVRKGPSADQKILMFPRREKNENLAKTL